jgi:hypothetical protein
VKWQEWIDRIKPADRWVKYYWSDEDTLFFYELSEDGWSFDKSNCRVQPRRRLVQQPSSNGQIRTCTLTKLGGHT